MSDEEADGVTDIEDVENDDLLWLDRRELILVVKSNPALYAKSSKQYCGKGFDKDLAWQRVGSSLSHPISGPAAAQVFYNIRQRFGKERRKVAVSHKGKSGQGATAPYVPTWPLYEDCLFLSDHIVARKTTSSYNIPKAATGTTFQAGGSAPRFARSSSLPPTIRPLARRSSHSPSPPVFNLPESSRSPWSSENDLFPRGESDTLDSQSSQEVAHRTRIAEEASVSPGSNQSLPSESEIAILKAIKKAGSKSKKTVPEPDNFAVKKKRDDDLLSQSIKEQTKQLSSLVAANLTHSVNPSNSVLGALSIDKVIAQGVPVERHLECITELLSIINQKYIKGRQE